MQTSLKHRLKYGGHPLFDQLEQKRADALLNTAKPPAPTTPVISNHGGANQIDAFYSTTVQSAMHTQKERIFAAIAEGAESQREIANATGIEKNLIAFRIKVLIAENRVTENGTKICQTTKKEVLKYRVNYERA
jgi:hypothetical protein